MGLAGGVIAVFGITGLGCITMAELLALKRHVEVQRGRGDASYSDVARATLGTWGSGVVAFMALTAALGGMAAYLAYVSTTLTSIYPSLSVGLVIAIVGLCLLPLVWLQDFSLLSKLAGFGTAAVLVGYTVTMAYAALTMKPDKHLQFFTSFSSAASGFGPIAFLLCIHFVTFPLMTASRASTVEGRFERLFAVSAIAAALINSLFGAVGFVYFGSDVSSIVLNDFPGRHWCIDATRMLVCIDLLCTYPFLFVATSHMLETVLLLQKETKEEAAMTLESCDVVKADEQARDTILSSDAYRLAIRIAILAISMVGGYEGSFGGLVSLVGDVSLTTLAFILPPIMTMKLLRAELTCARLAVNFGVLVIGVVVGTLSSGFTVANLLGYGS
eukprot:TRINITY_DN42751_c0_g1_i1.p1 TRINITY_DN42751_c0_g1~~TRINITY_DN42751_c0_g1_i1.p1  ORF type:complete len:455 (+),score=61.72 TRINITY_DN42751_c0_g1_i1:205-1365(+)